MKNFLSNMEGEINTFSFTHGRFVGCALQIRPTKGRLAREKQVLNEPVPVHRAVAQRKRGTEQEFCRETVKGLSVNGGQLGKDTDMGTRQTLCGMVFLGAVHPSWGGVTSLLIAEIILFPGRPKRAEATFFFSMAFYCK